jgi:hypothetical protein
MLPDLVAAAQQPIDTDFLIADDIFVKQICVPKAQTYIPQHSHEYDHTTMLAKGSVIVWIDGEYLGAFYAPKPILIGARKKHLFLTLEDDTMFYCIHNIARAGSIEVHEDHHLVDGG